MNHKTTPENTGAIYVAEVAAVLPPLDIVQARFNEVDTFTRFRKQVEEGSQVALPFTAYEEQFAFMAPEAQVLDPTGEPIYEDYQEFIVTVLIEAGKYVLVQTVTLDDDEYFTELFSPRFVDQCGILEVHTAEALDANIYLIPQEACGSPDPVRAAAFLCVGTEAVEMFDPPSSFQQASMAIAADILLDR